MQFSQESDDKYVKIDNNPDVWVNKKEGVEERRGESKGRHTNAKRLYVIKPFV
jgi:hypothetical protein